eukprot:TRINITY_DN11241_c0_g1_i1.p1 TRINITY_DN11241_c0_g1~~TRINITY_DN11241_c0_g1_i1.p1  ORF type:complete len:657 (+),score=205.27 TRINITY_DN11241_c0_g1_i1:47-1972(+)
MTTLSKMNIPKTGTSWMQLIEIFTKVIVSKPKGRVLITIWTSFVVLSLGILPVMNRRKRQTAKEAAKKSGKAKPRTTAGKTALRELVNILKKHTFTKHGGFMLAYVITLCTRILITVELADQGGRLGSYMGARNWEQMFIGQGILGLWFMFGAGATALMKFLEKRVTMSAREILYNHLLDKYLDNQKMYYHMAPAVPDTPARLTTDLEDFCTVAVKTTGHILKPSIDVLHLSYVIANRIGIRSLLAFLSFFVVSQKMLQGVHGALPKSLKDIAADKQSLEARLRSHHEQLHNYREQVAIQGGTATEKTALAKRYKEISSHQMGTAYSYAIVDVLNTYVLKYGGAMCGFSVLIPAIFLGDPKASSTAITSTYLSNSTLLQTLATEIKDLVDALVDVTKVQGLATRITGLTDAIRECKDLPSPVPNADDVHLKNITIIPPSRDGEQMGPLVSELNLDVAKGEHTVVRGPNGIGKTSLFRTLCGLWKPVKGEGAELAMPQGKYFAVSQDCYFPSGASLKRQITYPEHGELSDDKAVELLERVGLEKVMDRVNEEGVEWRVVLSGGQKQRLSWARLLHHNPVFALIDEGTSAVDTKGCHLLHTAAKEQGITLISISHHATVDGHHDTALDFLGEGKYSITKVKAE